MDIMLIVVLAVLGALLGSFAAAQVWRLRARQLIEDQQAGEPIDAKELASLKRLLRPLRSDRSECLSCHHQLAWYDLLPIVSWLSLQGKCRYCRAPIGATELMAEIGLGMVFALSYAWWPHPLGSVGQLVPLVLWLVAAVIATILLIYDAKWSLLPFELNIALIVVGVLYAVTSYTVGGIPFDGWSLAASVALLGGLYFVFALFGWVGIGDGILGVGLALFLGSWHLAFLTLFLANLLGCLMIIPLYLQKKLHKNMRIPFGPFLIVAATISLLFGEQLIIYFSTTTSMFTPLML